MASGIDRGASDQECDDYEGVNAHCWFQMWEIYIRPNFERSVHDCGCDGCELVGSLHWMGCFFFAELTTYRPLVLCKRQLVCCGVSVYICSYCYDL